MFFVAGLMGETAILNHISELAVVVRSSWSGLQFYVTLGGFAMFFLYVLPVVVLVFIPRQEQYLSICLVLISLVYSLNIYRGRSIV